MFLISSWPNRQLTSLWFTFKWEVYMGKLDFLSFQRMNFLMVLCHLVALISSSERPELLFIVEARRHFQPQNAMTISTFAPVFKQQHQGHLRPFSAFSIYTRKAITYQREFCFKLKRKTRPCFVCHRNVLSEVEFSSACFYTNEKNSRTWTTRLIRDAPLMGRKNKSTREEPLAATPSGGKRKSFNANSDYTLRCA